MAAIIADNIISPLGFTSEANYLAIKSGNTALCHYETSECLPFGYTASLFTDEQNQAITIDGYTRFESLAINSLRSALQSARITVSDRCVLIVSSTKGNVELLQLGDNPDHVISPAASAMRIAHAIGLTNDPIVVCNACISGVSALILGSRLIDAGAYDYALVCGIDVQNPFVISGFQSLKALSPDLCRPFDIERLGLNLGEAAATIILGKDTASGDGSWHLCQGAVRNDAYHITNPSPIGEGCCMAMKHVLQGIDPELLAQVNAHGTATMYNDQMESKAISRAGLSDIPTNGLKGYLGHTMGAAGVIETVLTMHALDDGTLLGTKGYDEIGVSGKVRITAENQQTDKRDFLKIISGFGGCNGAIHLSKGRKPLMADPANGTITHTVRITPETVSVDGNEVEAEGSGLKLLTWLYKTKINDYPKYYKMDPLARLGFVATELLLQAEGNERYVPSDDRAIIFFNYTGSANADIEYLKTISDPDNFFPSPSLFVYTLPNIVSGEIAIRNHCHGETAFYILSFKNWRLMSEVIDSTFADRSINSIITGWLEYRGENDFECDVFIVNREAKNK